MLQRFVRFFVIISSTKLLQSLEQCQVQSVSEYGYYLAGHVISTKACSSLSECAIMCSYEFRCKSFNFRLNDKSCDLNDADRYTHPADYGPMEGFVYKETSEKHRKKHGFKSCAEISHEFPQGQSGYYWVKIEARDAQVYCDMDKHGGGWTLVASISSTNNNHLQGIANNCLNSVLCVPVNETVVTARKLSDQNIHKLALTEGTFRVDVSNYSIFYQIPSGPENFNSSCASETCPRIITSGTYPYQWETNHCTSIDQGYQINGGGCYRVFDGHDNAECDGSNIWRSSSYNLGKRALYGYPCVSPPLYENFGIFYRSDGMVYVK